MQERTERRISRTRSPLFSGGLVTRVTILVGLMVLGTAIIIYVGSDFRTASLYREQHETRMRLLAQSMSYGIKNVMVSAGSKDEIKSIVSDILQRTMSTDTSIIGCLVSSEDRGEIYNFVAPGLAPGNYPSIRVDIISETRKIGTITIHYIHKDILENEKTHQVVVIGNTVASVVRYFLKRMDYFQVRYLAGKIMEEDPDVLYSAITGPSGEKIFSHRMKDFQQYLTPEISQRAQQVSPVQPVVVQEVGRSEEHGGMVEVAVLVNDGTRRLGVVRIGYSMASLAEALARSRLYLSLIIFGATLVALGVAVMLARSITRPLEELAEVARIVSPHVAEKELHLEDASRDIERLSSSAELLGEHLLTRGDEVGELASSFRDMIANLVLYIGHLKLFYQKINLADRLFAMGQLSAGIAHEINNPLTIISTYTQMLLKNPDLPPDIVEDLNTIKEEIQRISEKVKDLQSFSQEARYDYNASDIHQLLVKTLDLCRYQMKKNDVRLQSRFDPAEPLYATVDAGKIRQVFLNLILNSIQAMEESATGALTVETGIESGNVIVRFTDSGSGIPDELLSRVFDPFFTTKRPGSGTGLGLAICYSIIQSHGGSITAENSPEGGASFEVSIPAEKP